jgi:hypothetical protein
MCSAISRFALVVSILALFVAPCHAARMYALAQMDNGFPKVNAVATPYYGYQHLVTIGATGWGLYQFSGTGAQLLAINALPEVVGLCGRTDSGAVVWSEGNDAIEDGVRTKLNNWLSARGLPTIPAGTTKKQVVLAIARRVLSDFDWEKNWIRGPEDD